MIKKSLVNLINQNFKTLVLRNFSSMHESAGYPSSSTKLSQEALDKLTEFPEPKGEKLTLSWFQDKVWSQAAKFEIPPEAVICGMQANIFKIVLTSACGSSRSIIGKRMVPSELPAKANLTIWKDFLESAKREVEFYQNLKNTKIQHLFPKVYYSNGYLDDQDLMNSFYLMLMEDVSDNYYQNTSMNANQAKDLMKCLAEFHASNWSKYNPDDVTRGTFWVLSRRKPLGEVENAEDTWKGILSRFPLFKNLTPNVQDLATKLASKAEFLDDFIASKLFTTVHGDCKGWNIFFKKESCQNSDLSPVLFIDLQWTGIGHPLQDVAYSLTTTLEPELLNSMDDFVDIYLEHLKAKVQDVKNETIDAEILKKDFNKVWLDYSRGIITGLWKRFSPESIEKNKSIIGPSMIGRSLPHAEFIIKRIDHLLDDCDKN